MTDLAEKMAEAYWNAYRDGYYAAGGRLDYPVWRGSRDPVRNETLRCMRFAAEVARNATPEELAALLANPPQERVSRSLKPGSTANAVVNDAYRVAIR